MPAVIWFLTRDSITEWKRGSHCAKRGRARRIENFSNGKPLKWLWKDIESRTIKWFLDPAVLCSVLKYTMSSFLFLFFWISWSPNPLDGDSFTSRLALSSESNCRRRGPFPHTKFHSAYMTCMCVHQKFWVVLCSVAWETAVEESLL